MNWIDHRYTLRHSGGFAADTAQIILKGHGIFCNIVIIIFLVLSLFLFEIIL